MARSSYSIRSVLRRLVRSPRRDLCSRGLSSSTSYLRGSLVFPQFDESVSVLSPPVGSCFAAFSRNLQRCWSANVESDGFPRMRRAFSPSESVLAVSSLPSKSKSNIRLNESPELIEQRWRRQARFASSSFVLHSMVTMPHRGFASGGSEGDKRDDTPGNPPVSDGSPEDGGDLAHRVKDWAETTFNGVVDSAKAVGEAVDGVTPQIKSLLEAYPVIKDISVPVGVFTGAWVILPRVLRRMHSYVEQGSAAFLKGPETVPAVPYELSGWKAMEDPARLFATFLTLLQVGILVAPNAIAQYEAQFWTGGSLLCLVWFMHRWKSYVLKRWLTGRKITKEETERYLGLDKYASLVLIFIGALGVAEAAGVAVSSLLTVGGIGGIATAFAAREILSNLLTGLTLSFSKPFTVGDSIKAGAVEGRVEEVGLTSTRLLNLEKNPIIVPNAFFTSQAIVNKSRAPWRALAVKIPIQLKDFEKVPTITLEIREMLYRNPQVYLDEDKPCCHIAQFSPAALELAIGCNIKPMSKNEFLLVEQDILVEAARIITISGATLGGQ